MKHLAFILFIITIGCSYSSSTNASTKNNSENKKPTIKLALLHLELKYADIDANYRLLKHAIRTAAKNDAKWIVTPELVLTGYRFDKKIGTDWIETGTDKWVQGLQDLTAELKINLFLSHLEKTPDDWKTYNTLFVINTHGKTLTRHHKINTIPISEAWSTPGKSAKTVKLDGYNVGLLICADAWPEKHAKSLKQKGAELIISTANWAPGKYGPKDTWELRSKETSLPLIVANRTGIERSFDLTKAESVLVSNGKRLVTHTSESSSILLLDWEQATQKVVRKKVIFIEKLSR